MTVPSEYNVVEGLLGLGQDISILLLAAMDELPDIQ
jgi:hypothetical protein